jgi:hypothetical protein
MKKGLFGAFCSWGLLFIFLSSRLYDFMFSLHSYAWDSLGGFLGFGDLDGVGSWVVFLERPEGF